MASNYAALEQNLGLRGTIIASLFASYSLADRFMDDEDGCFEL